MTGVSDAERRCFTCGHRIPHDRFEEWPDAGHTRYAICDHCGAVNEQYDTVFVVLDRGPAGTAWRSLEAAPSSMDVYALVGGGWRACCDCGLTAAMDSRAAGWSWVLDHQCMAPAWQRRS
jgi:hypothetical protein